MNAYIWKDKQVSNAWQPNGFLIVIASNLEEARQQLSNYEKFKEELKPPTQWTGRLVGVSQMDQEELNAWSLYNKENQIIQNENVGVLSRIEHPVSVASHILEPPGKWEGSCYRVKWDLLLTEDPIQVVPLDQPQILAYYYGQEG